MITSTPLRIGVRILIILLWLAVALADVIIVDNHVAGFAILIGSAWIFYRMERKFCRAPAGEQRPEPPRNAPGRFWLQRGDGSFIPITDESVNGIRNAMNNFNWEGEVARYRNLKDAGVPPGMGLGVLGGDHFVHITTTTATSVDVLYVRGNQKPKDQIFKRSVPIRTMVHIIVAYMTGDEKKLMEILSSPLGEEGAHA